MSLLDQIRIAQRDAGEAVALKNLQRMGFANSTPLNISPADIDMDALNKDLADYRALIARLRGQMGVMCQLLKLTLPVIETAQGEMQPEADMLNTLESDIKAALRVIV